MHAHICIFESSLTLCFFSQEHEGIKPFKCGVCDYATRAKANLQAHMLRHSDWKPFACSFCGKRYKSKTALRWHERSHPNGRLFKCDKYDQYLYQNHRVYIVFMSKTAPQIWMK